MLGEEHQAALRNNDHLDWEGDWGHCKDFTCRVLQALIKKFDKVEIVDRFDFAPGANYRRKIWAVNFPNTAKRNTKTLHRAGIPNRDINNSNVAWGSFSNLAHRGRCVILAYPLIS
jgi:hypothetical protein